MTEKSELIEQSNLAFDFLQKMYLEVSYLIKQIEGILAEEEEGYVIGRPGGYAITAKRSLGLEATNVNLWPLRKFAVFFVPKEKTQTKGGQVETKIDSSLKVLYLRVVLNDRDITEPVVYSGVLYNIQVKPQGKWINKFEKLMGHFEYNDKKVFQNSENIDYEDGVVKLQGKLIRNNLFEINDSEAIITKIVRPSLELYRKHYTS